eukprot:COSAG01_NODE_2244_length_8081_cov_4.590829_6_plen_59_part_00
MYQPTAYYSPPRLLTQGAASVQLLRDLLIHLVELLLDRFHASMQRVDCTAIGEGAREG